MPLLAHSARRARITLLATCAGAMLLGTACEDGGALQRMLKKEPTLTRWEGDSLLLETKPELLFRIVPDGGGAFVTPVAMLGAQGVRSLRLGRRGWRRVDAEYLQAGNRFTPYEHGEAGEPVRMFRGMWQPGATPIDSLSCNVVVPMGRAFSTGNTTGEMLPPFGTSGNRPPLKHAMSMSGAELQRALENVGTLIAPSAGIPPGALSRYERRIHQIPAGVNGSPSVLVEYNDPEPLPDTVATFGERPRQLIIVLNKGRFGFRQAFKFSTVGTPGTPPRLRYMDHLDVDDDGVPEILLGLLDQELSPLFTMVLRFENDTWHEVYRFNGNRCQF